MSDLRDFLNWFDGFADNIDKTPNAKQWAKIKERVAALKDAAPFTEPARPAPTKLTVVDGTIAKAKPSYPFYVDTDGIARNKKGDRIMPSDVTDILHDLRGIDGDTKTITWADGSQGVRELNASIAAA